MSCEFVNAARRCGLEQLIAGALLASAWAGHAGAQNIVANGGFEADPPLRPLAVVLPAGSAALPGWTVDGPVLHIGSLWVAFCDIHSIHLNTQDGPASISQSLTTVPGTPYRVSFRMAGHPVGTPTLRFLRVSVLNNATTLLSRDLQFDVAGRYTQEMGWRSEQFEFVAASSSTTLVFESTTLGAVGPTVDCVVVEPTVARCAADVDDGTGAGVPDGGVTLEDLLFYVEIFGNGDQRADVDDGTFTNTRDGGVTLEDLLYYITRYEAGC